MVKPFVQLLIQLLRKKKKRNTNHTFKFLIHSSKTKIGLRCSFRILVFTVEGLGHLIQIFILEMEKCVQESKIYVLSY